MSGLRDYTEMNHTIPKVNSLPPQNSTLSSNCPKLQKTDYWICKHRVLSEAFLIVKQLLTGNFSLEDTKSWMHFQSYPCPNTAIAKHFYTAVQHSYYKRWHRLLQAIFCPWIFIFSRVSVHIWAKQEKDNGVCCTKRATCSYHLYKINPSFPVFHLRSKICQPDKTELS